jgi:hypothetical protein
MKKPEWSRKMTDPNIITKWKAESAATGLREPIFEYAMKELAWLAKAGDADTGIEPTGVDFVWVRRQRYLVRKYAHSILRSVFGQDRTRRIACQVQAND